jgi:uncharacterized membrane protein
VGAGEVFEGGFPAYYSINRREAMDWLRENTRPDAVVLASPLTGMFIPAMAGNRVVAGHWAETLERDRKETEVREFFDLATPESRRREILDRHGVRFIFYGQWEAAMGDYSPALSPGLFRLVWDSPTAAIFERIGSP